MPAFGRTTKGRKAAALVLGALAALDAAIITNALVLQSGRHPEPLFSVPEPDVQTVLTIQRLLADLGYGPGPIDGRIGKQTKEAIERFERDRGMPVTGTVQDRLLKELRRIMGSRGRHSMQAA